MDAELTVAEAAETLVQVVERVRHGESLRLTEAGITVALIIPAETPPTCTTGADLARWWNDPDRPRLTPEEADAFAADLGEIRRGVPPPEERSWE